MFNLDNWKFEVEYASCNLGLHSPVIQGHHGTICITKHVYCSMQWLLFLSLLLLSFVLGSLACFPWELWIIVRAGRTPWTVYESCRKAASYTGRHKYRRNADRYPFPEWDSNPWSQCLSGRRHFTVIGIFISGHEYYQLYLDSPLITGGCQPIGFIWRPWDVRSLNSSAFVKRKYLSICAISGESWTTQVVYLCGRVAIVLNIWSEFSNSLGLHTDVLRRWNQAFQAVLWRTLALSCLYLTHCQHIRGFKFLLNFAIEGKELLL
jgi:hypothetical protein